MSVDVDAIDDRYRVDVDTEDDIDPREWQRSLEESFLEFYRQEAPESYMEKADRAEEVFDQEPDSVGAWPLDPRGRTQAYLEEQDIDADALYDAAVEDLTDVLYGQVQARAMQGEETERFRERIDRFRTAFDRLDVGFYEDIEDEYVVRRPDGPGEIFELGRDFGTCIGFDVSYEAFEGTEVGDMYAESIEDPHTMYFVVEREGEPVGFSRNLFLEEVETGDVWLGIDTLELPRDRYEEERDALKPLALASIQAGMDAGADAVGVSAREGSASDVAAGYGGVGEEITYEKVGEPVRMPSHLDGDAGERTVHPLLERFERF